MLRIRHELALYALTCSHAMYCSWGFSAPCQRFHVMPPTVQIRLSCVMSSLDERHEGVVKSREVSEAGLTRGQLFQTIPSKLAAVFALGYFPEIAGAALPTVEDYTFGTGSKVSKNQNLGEGMTLPQPSVNPNNVVELLGAISGELDYMQTLVKKERWGDALARLKTFPLTALKSPTLGLSSVNDVAHVLGITKVAASEILEASVEAGLTLKEVQDVIFSNTRTLEYFNSVDLKQIQELAKTAKSADVAEPLGLLDDTIRLVDGVKDMVTTAPRK